FMVAKLPVTQMLWRALMRSQPWSVDGSYLPVTGVSWYDCVQFCNKLSKKEGLPLAYSIDHQDPPTVTWDHKATGFRLLTEAEWEYAARAGEDHVYSGGNELDMVGWAASNSRDQLQSAGRKRANAWGIQDMSGLVVEWVWDRGGRYPSRPQTDPTGMKKGMTRVGRGGSWMRPPENAAVTDRQGEWPTKTPEDWGFRIGRYVRST
ncbi:MAG: SUMF1/EgtB/PvdO family nonheme iron enzyme, partial [Myxococcota bacterium]